MSVDPLSFVAALVTALAWPVTIVVVVLLLRREIVSLFPRLKNFKFKDLQAEFAEELAVAAKVADEALPALTAAKNKKYLQPALSDTSIFGVSLAPASAIDEAWKQLLSEMEEALNRHGIQEPLSSGAIERELVSRNLLPTNAVELIRSLKEAHDQAIRLGDFGVESSQALGFVQLTNRLIAALNSPALISD
jgi:hypothetical protein